MELSRILITGANGGLGKETAKQLAVLGAEKIYLACRNIEKGRKARSDLERATGKQVFEVVRLDLVDPTSIRQAVSSLNEPIDGLLMNAGGPGGTAYLEKLNDNVTRGFATNVLGHVVLTVELLRRGLLRDVAVFAGTEVIRGVPEMGLKPYRFEDFSVDEFRAIADGSRFPGVGDPTVPYGPIKAMGVLWLNALARQHPNLRFLSMSPGGTIGTGGTDALPPAKRLMFRVMMRGMAMIGRMHKVDVGAKRFVDALTNTRYRSGHFYASAKGVSGDVGDQTIHLPELMVTEYQDNAQAAIEQLLAQ